MRFSPFCVLQGVGKKPRLLIRDPVWQDPNQHAPAERAMSANRVEERIDVIEQQAVGEEES